VHDISVAQSARQAADAGAATAALEGPQPKPPAASTEGQHLSAAERADAAGESLRKAEEAHPPELSTLPSTRRALVNFFKTTKMATKTATQTSSLFATIMSPAASTHHTCKKLASFLRSAQKSGAKWVADDATVLKLARVDFRAQPSMLKAMTGLLHLVKSAKPVEELGESRQDKVTRWQKRQLNKQPTASQLDARISAAKTQASQEESVWEARAADGKLWKAHMLSEKATKSKIASARRPSEREICDQMARNHATKIFSDSDLSALATRTMTKDDAALVGQLILAMPEHEAIVSFDNHHSFDDQRKK